MANDNDYRIAYEREKKARQFAEELLDDKSRQIYEHLQQTNSSFQELQQAHIQLKAAQNQLVQSEKMASLGQIAAGVAHEINNPIGFVMSNLETLHDYMADFFTLFSMYHAVEKQLPGEQQQAIQETRAKFEIDYIQEDIPVILKDMQEGLVRVREIVANLKRFARADDGEQMQLENVNDCLDNTLKVIWNELKYTVSVETDFAPLPNIPCHFGRLSQVFMNMLLNARQSFVQDGKILIRTRLEHPYVVIVIQDNGSGIAEQHKALIFDPFFTTKPVGQGTGLGLSISYSIIKQHKGLIDVDSEVGVGTTFTIRLPVF